jgi:hypothetical protein
MTVTTPIMQAVTAKKPFRCRPIVAPSGSSLPCSARERKTERNSGKSRNSGFSQFDRDAQIDLGHD